jgi:hypothetical protein
VSDYSDRKLSRQGAEPKLVVHILQGGFALCGMGEALFPGEWPEGHRWTYEWDLDNVTCEVCLAEARKAR